jgi:Ca2+/H+ antiporter, TMEM165/GDT1 family
MKRNRFLKVLKVVLFVAIGCVIFGFLVKGLWNWLMPGIFGWRTITFLQGLGLFLLSKILFGGFRGPGGRWRGRMRERWSSMTPEERERFRQGMRGRCGSFGPPVEPQV